MEVIIAVCLGIWISINGVWGYVTLKKDFDKMEDQKGVNIYFGGMCIAMLIYVAIGFLASKKVKNANDFYVAGRRAPMMLIAGSIIASYASTGLYMGDAGQSYDGAFAPLRITVSMEVVGYILGAIYFGRYLRRSKALTIPEFFGMRFCSKKVRLLAAITAILTMAVYLLSVVQGIGTLMNVVTGVDYNFCVVLTVVAFTILTVMSGSRGVLLTDTLMAGLFTTVQIVAILVIVGKAGGWFAAVGQIAADPETRGLSWGGIPGPLYDIGWENVIWSVVAGFVWMSVCMVGPWQSSRYLMAKNEHAVIRSAPIAAIGVFMIEFLVNMTAVILHLFEPDITTSSQIMIWGAMNVLPTFLGVMLLVGILSAGISSATTFLSQIGASFANDFVMLSIDNENEIDQQNSVRIGRFAMVVVSLVILGAAILNPPSIYWIMFLGGSIAACAWMPVVLASVLWKDVTRTGAFCGMLCGLLSCLLLKTYSSVAGISLPPYLDPGFAGIICNMIALFVGSKLTKITPEESAARDMLFVMPESEKDSVEIAKTRKWSKATVLVGVFITTILLVLWVIPYYCGFMT